jgi:8-oxo-dGTP pyrophosphatase MutT (NUDIX family)
MKVVSCFYEWDGKILILHRVKDGTWGIVGGGVEDGEGKIETIIRESEEEVGFYSLVEKYEEVDYWDQCPVLRSKLERESSIVFPSCMIRRIRQKLPNQEHDEAFFVSPDEALKYELSPGLAEIVRRVYLDSNPNI